MTRDPLEEHGSTPRCGRLALFPITPSEPLQLGSSIFSLRTSPLVLREGWSETESRDLLDLLLPVER